MMFTLLSNFYDNQATNATDLWALRTLVNQILEKNAPNEIEHSLPWHKDMFTENMKTMLRLEIQGKDIFQRLSTLQTSAFMEKLFLTKAPMSMIFFGKESLLSAALVKLHSNHFEHLLSLCNKPFTDTTACQHISMQLIYSYLSCRNSKAEKQKLLERLIALINKARDINLDIGINTKDKHGITPLMRAAEQDWTEAVNVLIGAGADIHMLNQDGDSTLILAAKQGHIDAVKVLISAGANISEHSSERLKLIELSKTLLDEYQDEELLKYLLESNIYPLHVANDAPPLITSFIESGCSTELIKLLITPERINQLSPGTGDTALIAACLKVDDDSHILDEELILLLIKHGADPSIKNNQNKTAYDIVKSRYDELGEDDVENILLKMALKQQEIYQKKDTELTLNVETFQEKIRYKRKCIEGLQNITPYYDPEHIKATQDISQITFDIACLHRDIYVTEGHCSPAQVIAAFEEIKPRYKELYTNAQFEIASFLLYLSEDATLTESDKRQHLIKALQHADNSNTPELFSNIMNTLSGTPFTIEHEIMPNDHYERLEVLTQKIKEKNQIIEAKEQEITELKAELAIRTNPIRELQATEATTSSARLIHKRGRSPVLFANYDSSTSKKNKAETENISTHGASLA